MKSIICLWGVCLISIFITGCAVPVASQRIPASPYCDDCVGLVTSAPYYSVPYYYVYPGYDRVYHPGYYVIPSGGDNYHYRQK